MNIGIGKIGQTISFDSSKWGDNGGNNEAPKTYEALFKLNPEHKFIIIGRSDWSRLTSEMRKSIAPHSNVIDAWTFYNESKSVWNEDNLHTYLLHTFKQHTDLIPSVCVLFPGMSGYANIPGIVETKEREKMKVMVSFIKYCSPIINFLNEYQTPWIAIAADPRYIPLKARDLINLPKRILSQYVSKKGDKKYIAKFIKSFDDLNPEHYVQTYLQTEYSGVEKMCLIDKPKPSVHEKTNLFGIVMHEGGNGGLYRGKFIEAILKHKSPIFSDLHIYGKWADEWMKDPRFKGVLPFHQLDDYLKKLKYTYIVPIDIGWCTAKYVEMIYNGVIPFFHPYYDTEKHLGELKFLRVSSIDQMVERINKLESSPGLRETVIENLQKVFITDEDLNGLKINNTIFKTISEVLNCEFEEKSNENVKELVSKEKPSIRSKFKMFMKTKNGEE